MLIHFTTVLVAAGRSSGVVRVAVALALPASNPAPMMVTATERVVPVTHDALRAGAEARPGTASAGGHWFTVTLTVPNPVESVQRTWSPTSRLVPMKS